MIIWKPSIDQESKSRWIDAVEFLVTLILLHACLACVITYIGLKCIADDPFGPASQHLLRLLEIPIPSELGIFVSISFVSWLPLWVMCRYESSRSPVDLIFIESGKRAAINSRMIVETTNRFAGRIIIDALTKRIIS